NYSLSNVYAGTYSVTAIATGYAAVTQNVTVGPGGSSLANFSLGSSTAGSISGRVTDASTNGISGATVSYSGGSANTDANGNYTLVSVAPGTYTLTALAPNYANATQSSTVTSGATTTTNFTLTPTPVVVSVSPTSTSLVAGGTQQFTATVTGNTNTSVNWSASAGT